MIAARSAAPAAAPPLPPSLRRRCRSSPPPFPSVGLRPPRRSLLPISSSLIGRRRRRQPDPKPSPARNLELTIDADAIAARASAAASRLVRASEERLRRFLTAGEEAFDDLRASVRVDRASNRVVFSCRESSLLFFANLCLWSLTAILVTRALVWLGVGFRSRWRFGYWTVIRRDRSLGGREVVVGRRLSGGSKNFRVPMNPLTPVKQNSSKSSENMVRTWREKQQRLPKWWPDSIPPPVIAMGKEGYQREADRLVRAILDYRMSGMDYRYDDIVQLREICSVSGAKASFGTTNARDSFYRASVDFVLDSCSRAIIQTERPQIGGEDVRQFIAGLADNIGLTNFRAATLVSAAVAARTRSCFLQCWALEVQGKRPEALEELLKICLIHRAFPPEEDSAEMEMVGSGLKRHFNFEQRKHLLNLYKETCVAASHRSIVEALGLER